MLSFLYVYSDHSILECYNLFSGVELSMRSFFVISEELISNLSQKIRYKYVLKEKKANFLRKTEFFAQALLDKSVAMATP